MPADDDISDVSMSDSSDDSESEEEQGTAQSRTQLPSMRQGILAAVPSDPPSTTAALKIPSTHDVRNAPQTSGKARRLVDWSLETETTSILKDKSRLPMEVWQHFFTFTPPKALGKLLSVNKTFNLYLDPNSKYSTSVAASSNRTVPTRKSDEIWQQSRTYFFPRMPAPLEGMNELSMWRIACNSRCTSCGKLPTSQTASSTIDQWHSGPGENGVRPIWAFSSRACGSCLRSQTIKEIDLLVSQTIPPKLITALPFIFLTSDLHLVASTALLPGQQPPSCVQISKYFSKAHVENIKQEYHKVQGLGTAAADEWVKGLDSRGKAKRQDVTRWEKWEASAGLQRMSSDRPDGTTPEVKKQPSFLNANHKVPSSLPPRPATFHGYSGYGHPPGLPSVPPPGLPYPPSTFALSLHMPLAQNYPPGLPQRFDSPAQNGFGAYGPPGHPKQPRTKEEADQLKAARRADIERRAMELGITPSVLAHMPSFQAALHIIKPLDETAWQMLKPRLLSQKADAQQREDARVAATRAVQKKLSERGGAHDNHNQEPGEASEEDWDDAQIIVKKRIDTYSDEVIRDGWNNGKKVTKETTPRFAAEVLLYVRNRFYAEVAKDDAAARAAGHPPLADPPKGPYTRKLTLENMRWVFETKIKPWTEQYRKDLFLCNGCDNLKWYALEGVCQHYASKHTTSLSSGSVVVHWRAEWPEEPPFQPEPHLAKQGSSHATRSAPPELFPNGVPAPAPTIGLSSFQGNSLPLAPVSTFQQPPIYQPVPVSRNQPQFQDLYLHQQPPQDGQYSRQGPYQPCRPAVQPPQFQGTPGNTNPPYHLPPGENGGSQIKSVQYGMPPTTQQFYTSGPPQQPLPAVAPTPMAVDNQSHVTLPVYRTEAYKAQLQDMAMSAKTLWNETAGVKDMPGSVRVYVIIFHILKRLGETYTEDPPFSMFVDGVQNVKEMRIVRNVNGLACKTCTLEEASKPKLENPYTTSAKSKPEKKLSSLPQLVNHFQSVHESQGIDWRTDMVLLPERKKIRNLRSANGIDERKRQLLIEALPEAFRPDTPLPVQDEPSPPRDWTGRHFSSPMLGNTELPPSKDKVDKYYNQPARREPSPEPYCPEQRAERPAEISYTDSLRKPRSQNAQSRGHSPYPQDTSINNMKRKAHSPLRGQRRPAPFGTEQYSYVEVDDWSHRRIEYDTYDPRGQPYAPLEVYQEAKVSVRIAQDSERGHQIQSQRLPVRRVEAIYLDVRPQSSGAPTRTSSRHSGRIATAEQAENAAEEFLDTLEPEDPSTIPLVINTVVAAQQRLQDGIASRGADVVPVAFEGGADPHGRRPAHPRAVEYVDEYGYTVRGPVQYVDTPPVTKVAEVPDAVRVSPQYEQHYSRPAQPERRVMQEEGDYRGVRSSSHHAPRQIEPEAIRREAPRDASPTYVEQAPPRRQYQQHYIDEPQPRYEPPPPRRQIERVVYDPVTRQEYIEVVDEPPRRPVQVQMEYVRVSDPNGDYFIERPARRQEPVYARYEDDLHEYEARERMRRQEPIYVDEQGQRVQPRYESPRQAQRVVYADEQPPRRAPVRHEDEPMREVPRYQDRRPVAPMAAMASMGVDFDEDVRQRAVPVTYAEEPQLVQRRQVVYDKRYEERYEEPRYEEQHRRRPLARGTTPTVRRDDPKYFEEYDPSQPALVEPVKRVQQRPREEQRGYRGGKVRYE